MCRREKCTLSNVLLNLRLVLYNKKNTQKTIDRFSCIPSYNWSAIGFIAFTLAAPMDTNESDDGHRLTLPSISAHLVHLSIKLHFWFWFYKAVLSTN